MKRLTLLVVICAATSAQSALAAGQAGPDAIRAACADDAQKFCATVQPGGGRIVACLKEHKDSLSDKCRQAAGTLDKRMPVYCLIAKSVQYAPAWTLRYGAISATLKQMFNQNLKRGWDQIRAADALSDETIKQQKQFMDNVGRQEIAMRSSGGSVDGFLRPDGSSGGGGSARTSSDNVSDLINNVDTMSDPSNGGTKKVSNLGGYNHFTDGFGHYITCDDPNATPENQGENGSWTRMTQAP